MLGCSTGFLDEKERSENGNNMVPLKFPFFFFFRYSYNHAVKYTASPSQHYSLHLKLAPTPSQNYRNTFPALLIPDYDDYSEALYQMQIYHTTPVHPKWCSATHFVMYTLRLYGSFVSCMLIIKIGERHMGARFSSRCFSPN